MRRSALPGLTLALGTTLFYLGLIVCLPIATLMTKAAGIDGTATFVPETYDAAAIMLLAMQAAKSAKPADYKAKIMDVVNAPGEKIYPGELAKALKILKEGGDIDYVGASVVEFIGKGESTGSYREVEIENGAMKTVKFH